jgi:hypothetical protein
MCVLSEHIVEGIRIEVAEYANGTFCTRIKCPDAVFQATFNSKGEPILLGWGGYEQESDLESVPVPPTEEMLPLMRRAAMRRQRAKYRKDQQHSASQSAI